MLKIMMPDSGHPRGFVGQIVDLAMAVENQERIHWAVSLLEVRPNDHILEIGFGPGVGTERLAALAPDGFIAGVDSLDEVVRQASRRNAAAVMSGRVEMKQGSAENLPYADQVFDKVLAINTLHHWTDYRAALCGKYIPC